MARLILATAEGQQAIDLRPTNSLGRHPNNTIQVLYKMVWQEHCITAQRDGRFVLRDLGSLNGTYVNGERVRGETVLYHGDDIALGSTRARYDDGSGVALPLPPVGPGAVQHPMGPPWAMGSPPAPPAAPSPLMQQPTPLQAAGVLAPGPILPPGSAGPRGDGVDPAPATCAPKRAPTTGIMPVAAHRDHA